MPRRSEGPPQPTELEQWITVFVEELQRLRPHVSFKLANTIARHEYLPDIDPKKAAAAYHQRQVGARAPSSKKARP